ncbi:tyrosine-type recombinase/integrase [Devosia sp. Naph2]|uniref:tyrosine-type recombinase/integrase n=1 Tax=Devosia polycyclovorans TaxID=3345148 RepID=UPI0035D0FF23
MATIRKRNGKWQAQIRRQGSKALSRTFHSRKDAEAWGRDVESRFDRGEPFIPLHQPLATLRDLLARYRDNITPRKKSADSERYRINRMLRHAIVDLSLSRLTAQVVAEYRDERLMTVSGETVRQDLVLIRQVLDVARREWGVMLASNPVDQVHKPDPASPRERRLHYRDLRRLAGAFKSVRNTVVKDVFRFALATGMRRGEILALEWKHVSFKDRVLLIPMSKNGRSRIIPLSRSAVALLERLSSKPTREDLVFPISANAFKLSWQRVKTRAGVTDLRFHDLRHEAVSRFFERGLSLPEVALISGHRDPRQLLRYTHLDASKIAAKLDNSVAIVPITDRPSLGKP